MKKEIKNCQNCKKDFTIEPDDFGFYEKMKVPLPTWCPECRFIRRLTWRNERVLYKSKCGLCGKIVFTLFSHETEVKIFCTECWWSDNWKPGAYGKDYDFSRTFFAQFDGLMRAVPVLSKWGFDNINCDYAAHCGYSKNVFLSTSLVYSEDVYYSYGVDKSKNIFDSYMVNESELSYEAINVSKTYDSVFLADCKNCIGSRFLFDCSGCQECFMCSGLRNQRYCMDNVQYSEKEYNERLKAINTGSFKVQNDLKEQFARMRLRAPRKYADIISSQDCTGDNIHNSRNVQNSFTVNDSENIKNCWRIVRNYKDSHDVSGSLDSELVYEAVLGADHNYNLKFHIQCRSSKNLTYCMYCRSCADCFGCMGLKDKQYCIFNKQYSKEEYELEVEKIRKQMNVMPYTDKKGRVYGYGEFFPSEFSLFAYNETAAQEHFPLTKEEAETKGYRWRAREERNYDIDIPVERIADDIRDIKDDCIGKVIGCAHNGSCNDQCTEAFRITDAEFAFYKRMNLPLPRLCPNCRHYERLRQRNPLKLWHRKCMNDGCVNEFETSYAPDRPEKVFCESCYNKEIY